MEVIGYNGTSLTSLFAVARDKAAPRVLDSAKATVERYKFVGYPKLEEIFADKLIFQNGVFEGTPIDAFEVYNDGVIVRGRCHSDILEAFMADVLDWFLGYSGGRRVETHSVSKNFESNLTLQISEDFLAAFESLQSVGELVASLLKETNGADVRFHPFGLTLAAEDIKVVGLRPTPFRIERKIGLEYDRGYFVSSAPLRTDDHLRVLQYLRRITSR